MRQVRGRILGDKARCREEFCTPYAGCAELSVPLTGELGKRGSVAVVRFPGPLHEVAAAPQAGPLARGHALPPSVSPSMSLSAICHELADPNAQCRFQSQNGETCAPSPLYRANPVALTNPGVFLSFWPNSRAACSLTRKPGNCAPPWRGLADRCCPTRPGEWIAQPDLLCTGLGSCHLQLQRTGIREQSGIGTYPQRACIPFSCGLTRPRGDAAAHRRRYSTATDRPPSSTSRQPQPINHRPVARTASAQSDITHCARHFLPAHV